jgi:hypothetical protein
MEDYSEILRYMGHKDTADAQLETLILSCLEKLSSVCAPHHVTVQLPCIINGCRITIGSLEIESKNLAAHLNNCTNAFVFAATLGAGVDRLIAQRVKIDSAEALCLQSCAAVQIENYCGSIEQELLHEINCNDIYLRPRFSPGYGDFDIKHQTDLLRILQAQRRIGLTETNAHMLTPLKSVTALIGVSTGKNVDNQCKCAVCGKTDCSFRERGTQ